MAEERTAGSRQMVSFKLYRKSFEVLRSYNDWIAKTHLCRFTQSTESRYFFSRRENHFVRHCVCFTNVKLSPNPGQINILNESVDPSILPAVRVDRGAIKFLLAGANMMCPGFISAGGQLPPAEEAIQSNVPVAIYTEGKEHPAAVGITLMATEEIKKVKKGPGVEVTNYLGDDLWSAQKI